MLSCIAGCAGGAACGAGVGAGIGASWYGGLTGLDLHRLLHGQPVSGQSFTVELDRTGGSKLGVKFDTEHADFVVVGFTEGLVTKWNKANPDRALRVGDTLTQVNDVRGGREQLLEECRGKKALRITIWRACQPGEATGPAVPEGPAVSRDRTISGSHSEAQWLEDFVSSAWKKIEEYLHQTVVDLAEPLQSSLPGNLKGAVKLRDEFSLGKTTPKFGPIVSRRREEHAVVIDIGIDISADVDLRLLVFGNIEMGVDKVQARGTLSVALQPLDSRPPFFGGTEVYFVNPPVINLHFCGAASIAEVGIIHKSIAQTIDDFVRQKMVVPRRIGSALLEGIDQIGMRCPEPLGVLRVALEQGRNLIASDFQLLGAMTSDPYVVIDLGQETWRSPTIKCSLNPTWTTDNVKDFVIYELGQIPQIRIFDHDTYSADDFIGGHTTTPVETLMTGASHELFMTRMGGPAGSLTIRTQWFRLGPDLPRLACRGPSQLLLEARVEKVTGLPSWAQAPFVLKLSSDDTGACASTQPSSWSTCPVALPRAAVGAIASLAAQMRGARMSHEPQDFEQVAAMVGMPAHEVRCVVESEAADRIKESRPTLHATEKLRIEEEFQADAKASASAAPQFDEIIRLLLPEPGSEFPGGLRLTLEIQDERGHPVGQRAVLLQDLIQYGVAMHGPMTMTPCVEKTAGVGSRVTSMFSQSQSKTLDSAQLDSGGGIGDTSVEMELHATLSWKWLQPHGAISDLAQPIEDKPPKGWSPLSKLASIVHHLSVPNIGLSKLPARARSLLTVKS